jgi:hypothetical protein
MQKLGCFMPDSEHLSRLEYGNANTLWGLTVEAIEKGGCHPIAQSSPGTRAVKARKEVPIQQSREASMVEKKLTPQHIDIADTFVRLYVFMTQYIDSCEGDTVRKDYPEAELQKNLASSRAEMLDILNVNPVVKGKVEKECERVLTLGAKSMMGGTERVAALDVLGAQRIIFQNKTMALSDLLAVYRAF